MHVEHLRLELNSGSFVLRRDVHLDRNLQQVTEEPSEWVFVTVS